MMHRSKIQVLKPEERKYVNKKSVKIKSTQNRLSDNNQI